MYSNEILLTCYRYDDLSLERPVTSLPPIHLITLLLILKEAKFESSQLTTFLKEVLKTSEVTPQTNARMLDELVGEFIEDICVSLAFIVNHSKVTSPFAREQCDYVGLNKRVEAFNHKKEIINLFTEPNES